MSEDSLHYFYELASKPEVLEMGGRGIGNLMEEKYWKMQEVFLMK